MSRIKVGGVWIDEGPSRARMAGYVAKSATGGYALAAGEMVTGDTGQREKDRIQQRASRAKRRANQ